MSFPTSPNGIPLNGNCFVVTGGASGLGLAASEALVRAGAKVCMWDRNEETGREQEERLGKDRTLFTECDVTDEASVAAALEAAVKRFGSVRGLVNSAGIGAAMATVSRKGKPHPLDIYENVLRINLTGTFNVMRLVAAHMAGLDPLGDQGARGVVINVASLAGIEGQDGQVAYAASKGGVIGMTKPASRDLGRVGVRVVTVAPGTIETPMAALMAPKVRDNLMGQQAFPREEFGQAEHFAHLCCSIITNGFINGVTIRIDGGAMLAKL